MGDAPASAGGQGNLVLTPATVGNTFVFDVRAENNGNQTLTHAQLALGIAPAPDLPAGLWIVDATTDDPGCPTVTQPTRTFLCELGNFGAGDSVEVKFRMRADAPVDSTIVAAFKVAENIGGDPGANRNTFLAASPIKIVATDTDHNADFIETGPFGLTTKVPNVVDDLLQTTTISVGNPAPGQTPTGTGFINIEETSGPTGCPNTACIGQTVALDVNDGAPVVPYLVWTLEIKGEGAGINKGGILHELDNGDVDDIRYTNATTCSSATDVDCFESYVVNKKSSLTVIVFRTAANGKVRAN